MNKIGKFIGWSISLFLIITTAYIAFAIFTAPFASYPLIPDFESLLIGLRNILIISCIIAIFLAFKS